MNNNYIDCNVVMLPTKDIVRLDEVLLLKSTSGKLSLEKPHSHTTFKVQQAQHLYFTSNEEIKEGDKYFTSGSDNIWTANKACIEYRKRFNKEELKKIYSKIESCTDSSLGLSPIQQSFIEEFVKSNGYIKSVRLEIEHWCGVLPEKPVGDGWYYTGGEACFNTAERLKLTDKGEVIVLPQEESENWEMGDGREPMNLRADTYNESQVQNKPAHTSVEEAAKLAYPEEGEYDDITELEFLRLAYQKGWKAHEEVSANDTIEFAKWLRRNTTYKSLEYSEEQLYNVYKIEKNKS